VKYASTSSALRSIASEDSAPELGIAHAAATAHTAAAAGAAKSVLISTHFFIDAFKARSCSLLVLYSFLFINSLIGLSSFSSSKPIDIQVTFWRIDGKKPDQLLLSSLANS
jgi:hypothetical protein